MKEIKPSAVHLFSQLIMAFLSLYLKPSTTAKHANSAEFGNTVISFNDKHFDSKSFSISVSVNTPQARLESLYFLIHTSTSVQ